MYLNNLLDCEFVVIHKILITRKFPFSSFYLPFFVLIWHILLFKLNPVINGLQTANMPALKKVLTYIKYLLIFDNKIYK